MADPFELDLDPVTAMRRAIAARARNQSPIQPFPEAQEESLLAGVASQTLGGLGYLGRVLDKTFGGRAVRGLAGGKPREALSILPFSDTLGITNPDDVVSGRDILTRYGITPRNDPNLWEAGDLMGFGVELALDPAMYLSFGGGALTKAGQLARKAGALPAGLLPKLQGFRFAESQLGRLARGIGHSLDAASVTPRGATVMPEALESAARAAGMEIVPQQIRTAQKVGEMLPVPPPAGMPTHLFGPATTLDDALGVLRQGGTPPFGRYARGVEPGVFETLSVQPRGTAGKVVQLGEKASPRAATPLAGLVGVGLPFQPPMAVFGTGPMAQRFAGALDRFGGALAASLPGRHLRALFDPRVDRATSAPVQELAAGFKRPAEERIMADVLGQAYDLRAELEPLVRRQEPEVLRYLLRSAEGVPVPATWDDFVRDLAARDPWRYRELQAAGQLENLRGQFPAMQDLGTRIGEAFRATRQPEVAAGVPTPLLDDPFASYVMRRVQPLSGRRPGEGMLQHLLRQARSVFDTGHSSLLPREDILRNFPEGTAQINELVRMRDPFTGAPLLTGEGRALSDALAEQLLRRELSMKPGVLGSGTGDITAVDKALADQARKMSKWMKRLDPRYATEQKDFFDPDIITNLTLRGTKGAKVRSSAEAIYEGVSRFAARADDLGPDAVPVDRLLREAGLTGDQAGPLAARALGLRGSADLAGYAVPKEIARDMTKWLKGWQNPEELAPVLAAYDAAQNLFKGWVTAPFPGFHARNVASGLFNMWRDDALSVRALNEAKEILQGRATVEPLPGMTAATPDEAMHQILREAVAHRVAFVRGTHQTSDAVRTALGDLPRMSGELPGRVVQTTERVADKMAPVIRPASGIPGERTVQEILAGLGQDTPRDLSAVAGRLGVAPADLGRLVVPGDRLTDVLGKSTGEAALDWLKGFAPERGRGWGVAASSLLDPTQIQAVGAAEDVNRVMRQMRNVGNVSEDWMRLAHYIAKRRQGFAPAPAAEAVRRYHIDYSDLSGFERNVMRRMAPFYTWSSRNLPVVLQELAERPAKLAETIRAGTGAARESEGFVPGYLGEGVAIPIPGGPAGQQRFLSSFGMPIEDEMVRALGSALAGRGDRALAGVLSNMNPLLKYPIEVATDTQLHSGRRLSDLRPSALGSGFGLLDEDVANPLTQILANTPAARVGTTIDKLIDPRKGLLEKVVNLGTGARVTDVDMERQREIAANEVIARMLRGREGVGHFERVYVSPENLPLLSPAEIELLRLQKGLERRRRAKDTSPGRPAASSPQTRQ